MIKADAETGRRGDAVIIFDANSKIIPQLCNADFYSSDSIGSFFNQQIKGRFDCEQICDE